ncbi:MAG: FAD-dependent oxidoreductase [Pseudomonadota bacterium]|jgi:glycerol-3-phosphate dehydrogenase
MNPYNREKTLNSLKTDKIFDILVVGGGATGCGIALDAASRGLSVALVEKNDFAEGTSGRSTKLLHGGVRYLESAVKHLDPVQYRLVRDGLRERGILLRTAPHLCHRIPLVTPLYRWVDVPYIFAGLKLYDLLAGSMNIGHSALLSRPEALASFPMLQSRGLKAGVSYFDGQFNDARLAVTIAVTAAKYGALVVNHVGVRDLVKSNGRIAGAAVEDSISGDTWEIRARSVINATGPMTDVLRRIDNPTVQPMLKVSSGTHLVLGDQFSPPDTGLLIPKTEDGRVLFVLPWEGQTLVGTTDEPAEVSEHPAPLEEEIDYLVHYICKYFELRFTRTDIKAAWSGLRPLVFDPRKADTAKLSRDHVLEESPSGLLTITGGKWTTYRKMACDAVNFAVKRFNFPQKTICRTERIMLHGSEGFDPDKTGGLADDPGVDPAVGRHLLRAYGDQAQSVLRAAGEGAENVIADGYPYLEAEVIWAVRREMAWRAMDVLARRTPLALLDKEAAGNAAPRVIELMALELGWDRDHKQRELEEVKMRLKKGI